MSGSLTDNLGFNLVWTALCIGLFGFLFIRKSISAPWAIAIAYVKVAIPFVYFAWFSQDGWMLLDDVGYYRAGLQLFQKGYTPITVLTRRDGIVQLLVLSGGQHYLYTWWNLVAQTLFGPHYYSAVFMNIGLTFVAGRLLFEMARCSGFNERYSRGLLAFFLVHWDVLAWSSFVNLKDTLVMTLTLAGLLLILRLSRRLGAWDFAGLLAVLFLFMFVRFYVPFCMMAAASAWVVLARHGWRRCVVLGVGLLGAGYLFMTHLPGYNLTLLGEISARSVAYGFLRNALTPTPWGIDPEYTFAFAASVFHWLLFVPACAGAWALWKRSPEARLPLIYLVLMLALYGSEQLIYGPRQRIQLVFVIVWIQYHALAVLLGTLDRTPAENPVGQQSWYPGQGMLGQTIIAGLPLEAGIQSDPGAPLDAGRAPQNDPEPEPAL